MVVAHRHERRSLLIDDEEETRVLELWRERLAQRIAHICAQDGISEAQIARDLGLDPKRLNRYKQTTREPEYRLLVRIAKALKTHPNWLLGFDDDPDWPKSDPMRTLEQRLAAIEKKL